MSAAEQEVQDDLPEDDLRGQLEAAMQAKTEEVDPVEEVEETAGGGRVRDEKGRFAQKEQIEAADVEEEKPDGVVAEQQAPIEENAEAEAVALAPPNGWTADAKAKWHELPTEVQAAAVKREEDIAKFTATRDEHASFGKDMYRTMQPYMAQIQAEGGTPATAVQSLLNTAYLLRTGSPEQKRTLLLQTAKQFGVDLASVTTQEQESVPAYVSQITNELQQLKQTFSQREQSDRQRLENDAQTEIATFAADPKHTYFETVKGHMAALIGQGLATDLKDAYDQACWAKPDIRATLEAHQRATEEQKRRADARKRTEDAKRKGLSITGGPGNTAGKSAPEGRSLREELESNMAASSGAV